MFDPSLQGLKGDICHSHSSALAEHSVTIYISIHPLNRLYLKAIQEMLKIKNDWI